MSLIKILADLPQHVRDTVKAALKDGKYSSAKMLSLADKLSSDTSDYDNMEAAGRIIIYDACKLCAQNSLQYIEDVEHRLQPYVIEFFKKYHKELDAAMKANEMNSYIYHDGFSGSSTVKIYLLRPSWGEDPAETIQQHNMRYAVAHWADHGLKRVLQCYNEVSHQWYTGATPTRCNAGTLNGQMSSCFLLTIDDDLKSILYTGVGDAGMISKNNGGLGISIPLLRHSQIGDIGMSAGTHRAMKVYDNTVKYVDQGGSNREGACTLFQRICHIDLKDFIRCKDPRINVNEQLQWVNTCIWMSALFFKRLANKGNWTVFCPAKTPKLNGCYGYEFELRYEEYERLAAERERNYQELRKQYRQAKDAALSAMGDELYDVEENEEILAKRREFCRIRAAKRLAAKACIENHVYKAEDIYRQIIEVQRKAGMPYIMHGDTCNYKSNQKNSDKENDGINGSNLCLEILERSTPDRIASCNLSSLNLSKYATGKKFENSIKDVFDFIKFGEMCGSVVENLNQVISHNKCPLSEYDRDGNLVVSGKIRDPNLEDRPLGIGASGFADVVHIADLTMTDQRATELSTTIAACRYYNCLIKSLELAMKNGPYASFRKGYYWRFSKKLSEKLRAGHITEKLTYQEAEEIVEREAKIVKGAIFLKYHGSPMSNGQLQFDLWQEEAELLQFMGDLHPSYKTEWNAPIDPVIWGQSTVKIIHPHTGEEIFIDGWDDLKNEIRKHGVRNSLLIADMPTASTAQTYRNAEAWEAHQTNVYAKQVISGNYVVVNRHMQKDLRDVGLWSKNLSEFVLGCRGSIQDIELYINDHPQEFLDSFDAKPNTPTPDNNTDVRYVLKPQVDARLRYIKQKYLTMYELSQRIFVEMSARRGRYVDQSHSLNIYIRDATNEQLMGLHIYTNLLLLKTGMYYLRQSPATQCGNFSLNTYVFAYIEKLNMRLGREIAVGKQGNDVCTNQEGCVSCSG